MGSSSAPTQPRAQVEREKVPGTAPLGGVTVPTLFGTYDDGWWWWALGRALQERTCGGLGQTFQEIAMDRVSQCTSVRQKGL